MGYCVTVRRYNQKRDIDAHITGQPYRETCLGDKNYLLKIHSAGRITPLVNLTGAAKLFLEPILNKATIAPRILMSHDIAGGTGGV